MKNAYVVKEDVQRADISVDVRYRKLKGADNIKNVCNNPKVSRLFIGNGWNDKHPKKDWNERYLDVLGMAVVAEAFNLDYLLYLDEVAEYVSKAKFKKIIIAGVVIILVIIAGVIVYKFIQSPVAAAVSIASGSEITTFAEDTPLVQSLYNELEGGL